MIPILNRWLDNISDYLSKRKGLLPVVGILLVTVNFILQLFQWSGWMAETNLFLHLGVVIALIGFLLAWAL